MDIRINGIIYSLAGEQRKTCEVYKCNKKNGGI